MHYNIYKTIKEKILFLEYEPGKILKENVLGREFGVSRTPMREVFMRLEWEKLVKVIPRTGTMVTEIEFQQMMNIFRARFEMEGLASRIASENMTGHHLNTIASLADQCTTLMEKNITSKNRNSLKKELTEIDAGYRSVIYNTLNNKIIEDLLRQLYEQTFRLWYKTMDIGDWNMEVKALGDELALAMDIFTKKDPKMAFEMRKNALTLHFERIKTKFFGAA
ncbi:MAG: GntR family transcriptional regulator [Desulfamplus sp.]|nr:GntR family transcriptional regulator [Desulfamplus sp.]